ncbi:MAG: ArsA family ATPase [Spirochaetales bacterium]|uniref:arsenite-transporting ATPase n=1 Tax=Candidatus Thalassospirochaeta sargassi TaxID=3119039 RepID=A0AAJ1MKI0_9SPIO|nr:ArsA family ATPase [Spirochaetales bacterium]
MKVIFFAGKGGVGKSTNSAIFSYRAALSGKTVLLNSIDPAHNLHDIFEKKLSAKPKELAPGLKVMETALSDWVKKYLKETEETFKSVYKYQEAFNLHKYFKTLRYSPGLEEYAVLLAIKDTLRRYAENDIIVFDTPPTALTMKFLALPQVNLLWLEELKKFREMILQKKEIIEKINRGNKTIGGQTDQILDKLNSMIVENSELSEMLKNPEVCSVVLVKNSDSLSLSESAGIITELENLNIPLSKVIVNKCDEPTSLEEELRKHLDASGFKNTGISYLSLHCREVTGLDTLRAIELPEDYLD